MSDAEPPAPEVTVADETRAVEALVATNAVAVATPTDTFWRKFGVALKKAAVATGQGTAWLARAGYDNRHYLPAVLNGAVGDKLARRGDGLAIPMAFRDDRGDLAIAHLGPQLARGNGHVVVFLHGLMANDVYWREPFGQGEGLGPMLARETGITPLYVRYNSGLHISENGRELAALMTALHDQHGERIQRVTLVGHSMGGLVARSAGHYGAGDAWLKKLRSVVLLGAPNDGSYLEQLSHLTAFVLDAIPVLTTRILSRVMDERSDGIKDLRLGLLVDEDWKRGDTARMKAHQRTVVPLLPGVDYHVVAGSLVADAESLIACYLGDGLVGTRSAFGRHVMCRVFHSTSHLALVAHPEVHEYVRLALTAGA